ncbi:MAG: hypothetical protein GX075_13145 [Firmicutes bacterium]|nr:hypothetical protein [Bacillota bacterium]
MVNQVFNNSALTGFNKNKNALTPEQLKLKQACTDFEAIMIRQMLEVMNSSTKFFGKGFGGDFFQSMFLDEISKQIAAQGLGLSKNLYNQLNNTANNTAK